MTERLPRHERPTSCVGRLHCHWRHRGEEPPPPVGKRVLYRREGRDLAPKSSSPPRQQRPATDRRHLRKEPPRMARNNQD